MKNKKVLFLTQAAMIAALYVVFTFISNLFGLASGAIQFRLSEAFTILPYFTVTAIPGLYIGCLLSNILTGCALLDIVFCSFATLLGAIGTRALKRYKWLAPIPPIIANATIVPVVLYYAYGVRPIWFNVITVGIGEIVCCGIIGMFLLQALKKYAGRLFTN